MKIRSFKKQKDFIMCVYIIKFFSKIKITIINFTAIELSNYSASTCGKTVSSSLAQYS